MSTSRGDAKPDERRGEESSRDQLALLEDLVGRGQQIFFTVGSLLSLAFGPLAWGYAWLRSSAARWLGWTALLTGITGMIWFVWLIDDGLIGIVLMVNVLASLVFFTGASVFLVARGASSRLRA